MKSGAEPYVRAGICDCDKCRKEKGLPLNNAKSGAVPSDKCRKCGQSHYDCLCNGDNHIPREARTRLPPPLAALSVKPRTPSLWDRAFLRFRRTGMDPSDAAYRADRLIARKRQRGFIDFGPAFVMCFLVGVLVGLALPWILRLLRLALIWLAGALS